MDRKKWLFASVVAVIFLWGLGLRAVETLSGNFLFGHDHGRDYLAAYDIVVNHKMTLIGAEAGSGVAGINGVFHGPGYFYLIALAFFLFRGDPYGGQLFMFLFGAAALAASYILGRKMFGRVGGVLAFLMVAVSPLIVSQSRFIWSSHPLTVFVILALYFVFRIPDRPRLYAPLAVFTAGLTYHFQLGVAVPMVVPILLSLPLVYRIRDWKTYALSVCALCLAFAPMAMFDIRHGLMATKSLIHYVTAGGSGGSSVFDPLRLKNHGLFYWYNFANTFTFEFGLFPGWIQSTVLYLSLPVVAWGLAKAGSGKDRKFVFFLLGMCVFTWVAYLLLNNTVWDYYLTHTRIAFILLYAIAGAGLWKNRKALGSRVALGVYAVLVLVLLGNSAFRMYISYSQDYRDTGKVEKIQGIRSLIDDVYTDAAGKPFSAFVFMPSVYTHPFDYLFLTYGKQKYGYVPGHEKHGLAYLIIIPDVSQPWRHKGWLETVVQGGTTVWHKEVLNGVILERREYP